MEILLKKNASHKKSLKKKQRLLLLLFQNDFMSIAELSKELGLSIPKVTNLLSELQASKWVSESEKFIPKNGRKPINFELDKSNKRIIVVDITIHQIKIEIYDLMKKKIDETVTDLNLKSSKNLVVGIIEELQSMIAKYPDVDIIGIGISMPGIINVKNGFNMTYDYLNANNKSLAQNINEQLGIFTSALNDSKATAIGEISFGEAKGRQFVLSVNADWGVGLGVISNGKVYQGANGYSGELGHIQLVEKGLLCSCGKVGCLDTVTSATSLVNRVKAGLASGRVSILSEYENNLKAINLEIIIKAANDGDPFSIDILYNIGLELGKGLAIALHLFNPEIIIINGILGSAYKLIINSLEHSINKHCLKEYKENLEIKPSKLLNNARHLGTLAFVFENKINVAIV